MRLAKGDGTFRETTYTVASASSVTTGDATGDGRTDIVLSSYALAQVTILRGDGAGGFTILPAIPTPRTPEFPVIADFDRDGRPDIGVTARLRHRP